MLESEQASPYPNPGQPPPLRPGRAGYWIAAGVVLAGMVIAAVWVVLGLRSVSRDVQSFPRSALPARLTVPVTEPGRQVIYYEGGRTGGGTFLGLTVLGPDGQQPAVQGPGRRIDYNIGGHSGYAMAMFDADRPGQYTIEAQGGQPGGAIAVSKNMSGAIIRTVVGPLATLFVTVVAGVVLAVVTYLRRRRSRTDAAARPDQPPPAAPAS